MMTHAEKRSAVLSIGRIYCDLIFTGLGHLPVLGREIYASGMEIAAGGGAFIAAAHLAHAGRKVALAARLGTDSLSARLRTECTGCSPETSSTTTRGGCFPPLATSATFSLFGAATGDVSVE